MNYSNCDLRLSLARSWKKPRPNMGASAGKPVPSASKASSRRHRMPKNFVISALSLLAFVGPLAPAKATLASWSAPTGDRWMYPHAADLGTRTASSIFGGLGSSTSDEKIGTLATIFNTTSLVAPGLGASNYLISSLTLTLTVSGNTGGASYDGSYDSYRSLLLSTDPNYLADHDAGRPIELYGAGFRNGFSAATFAENSPYGPGGADKGTRNVFPMFYDNSSLATDASNNVSGGFETAPFAIGQTTLTSGVAVPTGSVFTFTLDLTNPAILAYAQNALNNGVLDFVFTSLAAASQPGEPGQNAYLSFYNKENNLDGAPASLVINYTVAPEPGSLLLLIAAGAAFAGRRRICTAR